MTPAIGAWNSFWFQGGSAKNLAVARIVTALTALWVLFSRDLPAQSDVPRVFWGAVAPVTRWRYVIFPGHLTLERIVGAVAVAALIGVLLGIRPRPCAFVASLALYHLAPMEAIIWTNSPYIRGLDTPVIALAALSISPCGDALSLLRPAIPSDRQPSEYAWPVRLIQLQIVCIYFFSGYSKIMDVGWYWASAENMRAWMLTFNQRAEAMPFRSPGLWLAAHPALCRSMGLGTLAFELTFPVVLFIRRARIVYVPAALLFHAGIFLMMNIAVLYEPFFIVFFDWFPSRAPIPEKSVPVECAA